MTHHQLPRTENTYGLAKKALVSRDRVSKGKGKHSTQEGRKGSCGQMHEHMADMGQSCKGGLLKLQTLEREGRSSRCSVDRLSWQQHEGWVPVRFTQEGVQWELGSRSKI